MNTLQFSYANSLVPEKELRTISSRLSDEIRRMNQATQTGYEDEHASLNLPFDSEVVNTVKRVVQKKKQFHPQYLIVVGIGGSNLGTMAVADAVQGRLSNYLTKTTKVLYADTVDSDLMNSILHLTESVLQKNENVLVNVISKSGHTTETIANFEILVNLLQKKVPQYSDHVVVTTEKNSEFYQIAVREGFEVLEIPKKVGGRFSVFSPVGLFPLGLLGVDIDELLHGAQQMRQRCLSSDVLNNPAVVSASLIYLYKQKGRGIHDLFLFNPDLESVGRWYR